MSPMKRRGWRLLLASLGAAAAIASGQARAAGQADAGKAGAKAQETQKASEDPHALASWLSMGGDLRVRTIRERARKLDEHDHGDDRLWQRYRGRLWVRIDPVEGLAFNVRLVTEPRYYTRRDMAHRFIRQEVLFDRLNATWRNVLDLPLTATIGRQDLLLGSGWLVREGTPLDGSRTVFFDALRLTCELEGIDTTADLIGIDNRADSSARIRPFNDQDVDLAEQDEQGAILYLSNRSLARTRIDGYVIYKRDHNPNAQKNGREGRVYTLGSMVEGDLGAHWKYRLEIAQQCARRSRKRFSAFATNNRLSYHFNDTMDNTLHVGYEYLSGADDPVRHFDKLWGRDAQWSELYNGPIDSLDGRELDSANLHRPNLGWQFRPAENVQIIADYSLLFADRHTAAAGTNGLSRHGLFRGQLLKAQIKQRLGEHVHHRLTVETFFPGDFYTRNRNDMAFFLRYGIVFTW